MGMRVDARLFKLRSQYEHGRFELTTTDCCQLRRTVRENSVPAAYGVYTIHAVRNTVSSLVYIGKAGTLQKGGEFKSQTLRGRLTNKQRGTTRAKFFEEQMVEDDIDLLRFEWFASVDADKPLLLPFLVEAQLLAAYFEDHGDLPRWNLSA